MTIENNKLVVIPANVRHDKNISANAKLLYGEIDSLLNDKGYCEITNSQFASLYGVTPVSVSNWLSELEKNNYITRKIIRDKNNSVVRREIYLTDYAFFNACLVTF